MEMDLTSSVNPVLALNVTNITSSTDTDGAILDTKGYESVDIALFTAAITDGDYALTIRAGDAVDSESSPTTITDAAEVGSDFIIGTLPSFTEDTDDNAIKHVGCVTKKRWLQVRVTSTNVTTGGNLGAVATFGHAASKPTV